MPEFKKRKGGFKYPSTPPPTNKEVEEEKEASKSNLDVILDLVSRPSGAVAGTVKGGLGRGWENLTGEKKDRWSQNIADATGLEEDSWTARIGGFAGDAILDPLNLVPGGALVKLAKVGRASKAGMGGIHGLATAAKAGKLTSKTGQIADATNAIGKYVADTAKGAKGIFSNYAGLNDAEKAIVQLFDAKKHSLDDLAKEETLRVMKTFSPSLDAAKKANDSVLWNDLNMQAGKTSKDAGKFLYEQMMKAAQKDLEGKASTFGNMTDDFSQAVGQRLGTVKQPESALRMLASGAAKASASDNPLIKGDRAFKLWATRYNPLFYTNNMMGNVQQVAQEATSGGILDSVRGFADTARGFAGEYIPQLGTGVKGYDANKLAELGKSRGVKTNISSIYKGKETGGSLDESLDALVNNYMNAHHSPDGGLKSIAKAGKAKTTEFLDGAQHAVEGKSRQAAFNTFFKQAIRKGLPEKEAADEAALRVTQSLFDYEDVTPAVRAARSMPFVGAPFATWAVKNVPRQAGKAVTDPAFFNKINAATANMDNKADDDSDPTESMRQRGSVGLGKYGDLNTFFNPALTVSDVNKLPVSLADGGGLNFEAAQLAGPIGKSAVELATNRDLFTGKKLGGEGLRTRDLITAPQPVSPEMRWLMEMAPDLMGQMGATRAMGTNNPQAPYWMKKLMEYPVGARNAVKATHSIVEPEKATDKTPFGLGAILPIDMKSDEQLKVSKEFEKKALVQRAKDKKTLKRKVDKRQMRSISDGFE